jgi:hypothetical protein
MSMATTRTALNLVQARSAAGLAVPVVLAFTDITRVAGADL